MKRNAALMLELAHDGGSDLLATGCRESGTYFGRDCAAWDRGRCGLAALLDLAENRRIAGVCLSTSLSAELVVLRQLFDRLIVVGEEVGSLR